MSYVSLAAASSCGPVPAKTPVRFSDMHPTFRSEINRLLNRLKETGLPFAIRTVGRSYDMQCWAMCSGGSELSDPTDSAHVAVDEDGNLCVFAVDFKITHPAASSGWDVGLDKETHTNIVNQPVYALWSAFGSLLKAEFPKLEWGGDWKKRYVSAALKAGRSKSDIKLGFDPYHVQLKNYRAMRGPQPYVRCEGGRAVPMTATEAAARKATPWFWGALAAAGIYYALNR